MALNKTLVFRTVLTSAEPCHQKNQLTTVKFDSNQAKKLLFRVLFHLANSPLKCLILSRQVLTASFTPYKAVQIRKMLLLSAII